MYKVLVADDEHNIRNILDFSLHAEGFLVISALNGEDAFKLAVESSPDLIILDVMMPGQGGVETCRALKADNRTSSIPVILLTALAGREDRDAGSEAGSDAYITKPFSPQKVIDVVQELLGVVTD
ncbi:MAG: response regulator [Candidatus Krumholzibacteria bacterium]|nr:response regulator [Candidatus Krumholzibacteria bacterium]